MHWSDPRRQRATPSPVQITVNNGPTVSLTSPTNNASFTAPASITVTATANDADGSVAQVELLQGATVVATLTSAPYTTTVNNVAAGSYTFTARATDNLGGVTTSTPVAVTVNAPPTVTLTSPANNSVLTAPATISLAADAADSDGTVAQVEFFQGATLIATVTSAPYTYTLNNVATGTYSFTAKATDNQGAAATSAAATVTVNALPTVSLTSPTNNATFTAPASITVTAAASDSDGTIAQVEFLQGATVIATLTSAPYITTVNNVTAGSYTFTARATDNLGGVTTSDPVNVTVNSAVAQFYYIHTDQLDTPRLITNQVGQAVWRYDNNDPFGGNVPDENPSGLGTFEFPLRDEGVYFDKETGLAYNVNRYRDLPSGRFIQADPLGLEGGDLSLYVLRSNNPLSFTDPLGLWVWGDPLDQDLVNAITGFGDAFLLPELIRNAFEISGGVNQCSAAYRYGKVAGFLTGSAPFALRGAAALGATSFGRAIGLNSGQYWRIGPGVWKKNVSLGVPPGGSNIVPRLSIGPQRAGVKNPHFDLRSRLPYVPPVGGPGCDCQ